MLNADIPTLVLAPMDGITDAGMRALQGRSGAFTFSVTEFLRVSGAAIPTRVFRREVPELAMGGMTCTGMPVQVQLLGGDPERMAASAANACRAGATAIDINFGCPAPTVNRHDGGASLLKEPARVREIVAAVRKAVPGDYPVSAKIRLGWERPEAVFENAAMAVEGGAAWLTIHARTRMQGYSPPVFWPLVGEVRAMVDIPVVANGDIFSFDDFLRCREETGCRHFMIGRGALANPRLASQIARALGIGGMKRGVFDWRKLFEELVFRMDDPSLAGQRHALSRLKQWIKLAHLYGDFPNFHELKQADTLTAFFDRLATALEREVTAPPMLAA
jgi:tRNA-dihydrouridine synthase C